VGSFEKKKEKFGWIDCSQQRQDRSKTKSKIIWDEIKVGFVAGLQIWDEISSRENLQLLN
jgi:hypothetical protein